MKSRECFLQPLMAVPWTSGPLDWVEVFGRRAPLNVEIGFGCGEVLLREAQRSRDQDFVGIELNWERIHKTLREMTKSAGGLQTRNVRILKVDARLVFERFFAGESIDRIYSLYPCPWPKKGHIKHRLFSKDFLRLLNNRLKPQGEVKIVTDYYPYVEWILTEALGTGFQVRQEVIKPQYGTKFERRWFEGGQEEFHALNLLKDKHLEVPITSEAGLQTYKIKDFQQERFRWVDQTGDIAVVLKDMLFDAGRQKAMVHVVVAEAHLTQHFWISIIKKEKDWIIRKADGQNVFPTPGIAQALKLVYEATSSTVE